MPYTTLVAGTTITAAWANTNVRDQTIGAFGSTGACDSAITSPVAGMVQYLTTNLATEGLTTRNSAGVWRPPWNMPWGVMGRTTITTSFRRSSATPADVTGMTVTFTAVANRVIKVSVGGLWAYVSASCTNVFGSIYRGATDLNGATIGRTATININALFHGWNGFVYDTPSAGSVTYTMRMASDGTNNVDFFAAAGTPGWMLVEDLGPSGAPA